MGHIRIARKLIGFVLVVSGFFAATTTKASGWDYDLAVNPGLSNLTFDITLDTPLGGGSDSDNSSVSGTVGVNLAPPPGGFNLVRVTDLNLSLDDDMHFNINLIPLVLTFVGDIQNANLLMDATHGSPGAAAPVNGAGAFSQTGNLLAATGSVSYNAGVLGSDSIDLSTLDPESADFNGTVTATANLITLTVPIDLMFDLLQDTTDLGDARVHGTIVATGIPLKPGDTDGDHDVDLNDLGNLATHYGQTSNSMWGMGDFDSDGDVDLNDLGALATNYGAGQAQAFADFQALAAAGAVPEPHVLGLVALVALLGIRRPL